MGKKGNSSFLAFKKLFKRKYSICFSFLLLWFLHSPQCNCKCLLYTYIHQHCVIVTLVWRRKFPIQIYTHLSTLVWFYDLLNCVFFFFFLLLSMLDAHNQTEETFSRLLCLVFHSSITMCQSVCMDHIRSDFGSRNTFYFQYKRRIQSICFWILNITLAYYGSLQSFEFRCIPFPRDILRVLCMTSTYTSQFVTLGELSPLNSCLNNKYIEAASKPKSLF